MFVKTDVTMVLSSKGLFVFWNVLMATLVMEVCARLVKVRTVSVVINSVVVDSASRASLDKAIVVSTSVIPAIMLTKPRHVSHASTNV